MNSGAEMSLLARQSTPLIGLQRSWIYLQLKVKVNGATFVKVSLWLV